jgi:hypothetical protein
MIRKAVVLLAATAALVTVACASANSAANLLPPDFVVRQIGGMPFAARHVEGPISVNLEVDVINRSEEVLTLEQLRLETIGDVGAYVLRPQTLPFNRAIKPQHVETVTMTVPAISQSTIVGANGPVTIRGVAYFKSDVGKFRRIFMQPINDGMRGNRQPQ